MNRWTTWMALITLVGVPAVAARASVVDPAYCSVEPCDVTGVVVICPSDGTPPGSSNFTVNVRNDRGDPVPYAKVEVIFILPESFALCGDPSVTKYADHNGNATFNLSAGGCGSGTPGIEIWANSTLIRTYQNVRSPDYDGASGDGMVSLADFMEFTAEWGHCHSNCCHDYNGDNSVTLADYIMFSECWGRNCTN